MPSRHDEDDQGDSETKREKPHDPRTQEPPNQTRGDCGLDRPSLSPRNRTHRATWVLTVVTD